MPRERRVGSTPTSPTTWRMPLTVGSAGPWTAARPPERCPPGQGLPSSGAPTPAGARTEGRPLYSLGHARDHHHRPQEHGRPRGRAARRGSRPGRHRRHPAPVPAHPHRRLPTRARPPQHARTRPRARPPSSTRPSRTSSTGPGATPSPQEQLVPIARPSVEVRRGRGRQAAPLQGHRPGPPRGEARRLPQLPVPARDRTRRRRQGRSASWTSCATSRPRWPRSRIAAAQKGDWAVIGFVGTRDGRALPGRHRRAHAHRARRRSADPRLRGSPPRAAAGRARPSSTSPSRTTTRRSRCAARRRTSTSTLKELREKILPAADDELARSMGDTRTWRRCAPRSSNGSSGTPSTGPAMGSPTASSTTP